MLNVCSLICRYQIPEDWPYEEARRLFKEPLVCVDEEQLDIKWSAPDEEVSLFIKKFRCQITCINNILLFTRGRKLLYLFVLFFFAFRD